MNVEAGCMSDQLKNNLTVILSEAKNLKTLRCAQGDKRWSILKLISRKTAGVHDTNPRRFTFMWRLIGKRYDLFFDLS